MVDLTAPRTLAVVAGDPDVLQVIRVRVLQLPPPFDNWAPQDMWVMGLKDVCTISSDPGDCSPLPTHKMATLTCSYNAAEVRDWNQVGEFYIYDEIIMPSSNTVTAEYDIQVLGVACDPLEPVNYSAALTITQPLWGDLTHFFNVAEAGWPAPNGTVDVTADIAAVQESFANAANHAGKIRTDLQPCLLDHIINVTLDLVYVIDAFKQVPYPLSPGGNEPGDCPLDPCGGVAAQETRAARD